MTIPELSVRRPVLVSSLVALIFFVGAFAFKGLPVSLFPETNVPFVSITTLYPGAGPSEVETSISKPLEDEFSTLEGLKKLTVISQESVSLVTLEFRSGTNLDSAELRVRDKVALARSKFPRDAETPVLERFNPSNQPVVTAFVRKSKASTVELTEWTEDVLKPALARLPRVGRVEIVGGRKREVQVVVSSDKIAEYRIPLVEIAQRLTQDGRNVPAGAVSIDGSETNVRAVGQYSALSDVGSKIVSFGNGETPVRVKDLAKVSEGVAKARSSAFSDGERGVAFHVYRQSGANAVEVADVAKAEIGRLSEDSKARGGPEAIVLRDGAKSIRDNVEDVWESIAIGIALTIVVVYFFLGSVRSTLITGFAIPNSLMGAFILMGAAGFSINILTLLALSLCVGLLVDDAIVVRENIFKKLETGLPPREAAVVGANEVAMAVVAVTAAVLAMFGPVGALKGTTGQFFREFGMVVCFATLVSLFDALAVAPMFSAYFGGAAGHASTSRGPLRVAVEAFDRIQGRMERAYKAVLLRMTAWPLLSLAGVTLVATLLASTASMLPSSFLPTDQSGEFAVRLVMPPGSSLAATEETALALERETKADPAVGATIVTVGNALQEVNRAEIYVRLKEPKARGPEKPSEIRERLRKTLALSSALVGGAEAQVVQADISGAGQRAFSVAIQTSNLEDLEPLARAVFARLKSHPALSSPELELRKGGRELAVRLVDQDAARLGLNVGLAGEEMRARLEGVEVGRFSGVRDLKVRLKSDDDAPTWLERKSPILVPNVNLAPVDIRRAASFVSGQGASRIERVNRAYAARISADLTDGANLSSAIADVDAAIASESKGVVGVSRVFEGDVESFDEMSDSMTKAFLFGITLLFLTLASLYESFLLAALNVVALPLAVSGAFAALWLMREGLNVFSIIGMLLLLGVATKNSILLIDGANERLRELAGDTSARSSEDNREVIVSASVRRLRPILMTSLALIAGCLPIAIGLNEASAQRTGMGVAIVGGALSSTVFTLVFIPCLLLAVDRLRVRGLRRVVR